MAFEIRYYYANALQRQYRIRHGISMFFGTPCIKLIEKLLRRHLINSSDVFVIKGLTV